MSGLVSIKIYLTEITSYVSYSHMHEIEIKYRWISQKKLSSQSFSLCLV